MKKIFITLMVASSILALSAHSDSHKPHKHHSKKEERRCCIRMARIMSRYGSSHFGDRAYPLMSGCAQENEGLHEKVCQLGIKVARLQKKVRKHH